VHYDDDDDDYEEQQEEATLAGLLNSLLSGNATIYTEEISGSNLAQDISCLFLGGQIH
jgi:hypothetical protein